MLGSEGPSTPACGISYNFARANVTNFKSAAIAAAIAARTARLLPGAPPLLAAIPPQAVGMDDVIRGIRAASGERISEPRTLLISQVRGVLGLFSSPHSSSSS